MLDGLSDDQLIDAVVSNPDVMDRLTKAVLDRVSTGADVGPDGKVSTTINKDTGDEWDIDRKCCIKRALPLEGTSGFGRRREGEYVYQKFPMWVRYKNPVTGETAHKIIKNESEVLTLDENWYTDLSYMTKVNPRFVYDATLPNVEGQTFEGSTSSEVCSELPIKKAVKSNSKFDALS